MRTTLDIDDDVLLAAKDLARRQRKTAGEVLSELARLGLQGGQRGIAQSPPRYGFAPAPANGATVTNAQIDALREALGED
ncbi:MAG: antitoxin [Rhodanobacteraceae bacterium]|nr:antitoxin [Rhodanobacteraceae bacterium]